MFTCSKLRRIAAFLLCTVFSVLQVNANPVLRTDVDVACPGEAIVLTVKSDRPNPGANVYSYKYSFDKIDWQFVQSQTHLMTATADMPDVEKVYFQVVDETNGEVSNSVEVKRSESSECGRTCHVSSTGDFFNGTDFDPEHGFENRKDPPIPEGVVNFFGEGSKDRKSVV